MANEVCPACGAEDDEEHDDTCPFREHAIDLKIEEEEEKKDNGFLGVGFNYTPGDPFW